MLTDTTVAGKNTTVIMVMILMARESSAACSERPIIAKLSFRAS